MENIDYIENTGPVVRVGVIASNEAEAIATAEAYMGGSYSWADNIAEGLIEVVFERGYLS